MAPILRRRRLDPDLTPEEREARIAELRARRRARLRWLALRSAIGLGVLLLAAGLLAYWLLMTLGGRDFLLAQVVARLPAGTALEWREAEGPASGPLTMHDVRFTMKSCPDRDGEPVPYGQCTDPRTLTFAAARVTIDPDIRPLLGRLLRLDTLVIEDAVLTLPPSGDAPVELPRWPESLPQIGPLPLALQADAIVVDDFRVIGAEGPLIDIHSLRGGLDARDGRLRVERLQADSDRGRFTLHGEYAPRADYRMDLTGTAVLPAPAGRTRPRIGLVARGDVTRLDVAISGHAPAPARAVLTLRGRDNPGWRLRADAEALDPGLLAGSGEPGMPIAFELAADGVGGEAKLQGRFAQGDFAAELLPSVLRLQDQVIEAEPLALALFDGTVTLRGRADFRDSADPTGKFAVTARELRWGGAAAADGTPGVPVTADADFGVAGRMAAWAAIGKATLARDGESATVELDGRGDGERMTLRTLRATMPSGTLDGQGEVAWAPALGWNIDATLDGFDPGYFVPDWDGAVNGRLATRGTTRNDGGLDIAVDAEEFDGRLRGRALAGRGRFAMRGPAADAAEDAPSHYEGEIALSLGDSRVDARGSVTDTLDIDAELAPLQLDDFLPDARGRLDGQLRLTGARTAPDIDVDLDGSGLAWGAYGAEQAAIRGRLPWQRGREGQLDIDASGVNAGVALDTVSVQASGAIESLRASASVRGEIGALDLTGSAEQRGGGWRGVLESLRLAPTRGAAWTLQGPARFAQDGANWRVSESCFGSDGGGSLCVEADWPRNGLTATGRQLPLALAEPYLPERDDGRPWQLRGEIALDARVRPAGNAYSGNVSVRSDEGGLRFSERARRDVISYGALQLDAEFDPQAITGTLSTVIDERGRVRAEVRTGWDAYSALAGQINVDIDELTWLELFSPDIVEPQGRLAGQVTLGGTRAEPQLAGQAQLSDFGTEIPSLAIALTEGNVRLDALADGSARIAGSVRSGPGTLNIDGTLGWGDAAATPLELALRGENLLVSDTRDLRAIANPDLTVRYGAGRPLAVTGTVTVPEARIDLERLDDGVSASPDVVVLDPADPNDGPPTVLQLDLTLAMGEDVVLNGFGLEGTLGGELRVRQTPGREMRGSGTLQVGGRYKAYGQELRITRGNLVWSNDIISDPVLDIRAERRIEAEELTAGIDVTGRASAPQANVWTDPSRDQSEALAYLALGRSLSSVTGDESRQLDAASAALSAGGGLLASQLGASIGLDDAGVSHSRALGGSVLGVGKQLSPRLYVGFGVSLLGTGQVLTLKYLLSRGFDIEIESSTLENRGSLNWRRETD
ncbi:translocation/assembly module TamB domain-containing protein [Luteimonas suaedae]|uniref:translocation/assembly module TamB domain-containing protein n=1 Tax=Luteimonas suaedae TaxID=2605430 RepID=UPI0011ED49C5|nr:translocation/assembly module TamB domain-containing protein [Luteimonas suaedae]